ncbi:hypothetical protein COOONC_10047 [Cooperia oncophora]
MRNENYISYIYDVTVAYEDVIIDSETNLLKGVFPKNIHFNVKKYNIEEIPSDLEKSGIWLKELWKGKEEALKKFYESEPHKRRLNPSGEGYVFPVWNFKFSTHSLRFAVDGTGDFPVTRRKNFSLDSLDADESHNC